MILRSGSGRLSLYSLDDDWADGERDGFASPLPPRRFVVSNQLPIKSSRDAASEELSFEFDGDSLAFQLKDGFDPEAEVVYVGTLRPDVAVQSWEQDDVASTLYDRFRCVPIFLPAQTQSRFYHGFCKHYLWPLFHYMLPVSPSHGALFDNAQWLAYVSANNAFAERILAVANPDEDYVWIHDYHLMVLPSLLRNKRPHMKLGFFLHNLFPSSEIYRTIPVRNEILHGLLSCDLVGFHTYDYARHFLTSCSRILGVKYKSKRGYIEMEYHGRTVSLKILPVGVHMGQLRSVLSEPTTGNKARELRKKYEGKFVMVGADDMDLFKGIGLKFLAMGQLLEQHEDLRGKVILVQIANPARSQGKDIQDVESETNSIAEEINHKYGNEESGYKPIEFVKGPISSNDKAAYYSVADCCVVNALRDGMNLVPYQYTVCRQDGPVLDEGKEDDGATRQSVLIVSEFIGCSPSLSGAIRVNPWNLDAVADAMSTTVNMSGAEKRLRHEKHYSYISSHDVAYWAQSFDQDLERACRDHYSKKYWRIGFGVGVKVLAMGTHFRMLSSDHIAKPYKSSNRRLILLDYDGTLKPHSSVNKAPSEQTVSVLNSLCSDPKNVVFIVSGRGRDCLSDWFSTCEKLGISAEHGFFTRWNRDKPWETCSLTVNFDWKKMTMPVMELYTEATDGSFIETKECALVWHHQDADPDFGSYQAKELLDHLESVLANEPVVVKSGRQIVEVKPQGVSKGLAVESLISTLQRSDWTPDFVLCIGDDQSDEDMFETISRPSPSNTSLLSAARVFACTVGEKPSAANYYIDDTAQVINLLKELASPPPQQWQSNGHKPFEVGS